MARQLLLTIAAENLSPPATEANGEKAIKSWLSAKGLNFKELVIENGSGLSRVERISAEHLGQMLVSAYHSPVMPELMASLPILSQDGTIKKRLVDSQSNGRAHLKTGSIDGVSAIAGYVLDANNHRHVLVMLVNHTEAAASKEDIQFMQAMNVLKGLPVQKTPEAKAIEAKLGDAKATDAKK